MIYTVHTAFSTREQYDLDHARINSISDLIEFCATLDNKAEAYRQKDRWKNKSYNSRPLAEPVATIASELKQQVSSSTHSRPDHSKLTYDECGELGHIRPNCPKRKNQQGWYNPRKSEARTNVAIDGDLANCIQGSITNTNVTVQLDSGSKLTIVPDIYVAPTQYLNEFVTFCGVNNASTTRQLANVSITMDSKVFPRKPAIVPLSFHGNYVLLSVNLKWPNHFSLLSSYAESDSDVLSCNQVVTRSMVAKRNDNNSQARKAEVEVIILDSEESDLGDVLEGGTAELNDNSSLVCNAEEVVVKDSLDAQVGEMRKVVKGNGLSVMR